MRLLVAGLLCALASPARPAEAPRPGPDVMDPLAAGRALRAAGATLRALPDTLSGITRDAGSIAIIEHDGSNYDKDLPDGTPNAAARAAVAQRFYQTHGDHYDFLVVFTNFEFATPGALAFNNLVRNDVAGIGLPLFDNGPFYGSPGRLKGYIDMAAVQRYRQPPQSLDPGHPGFLRTLGVVGHEVGHNWLSYARYRDAAGQASSALLGQLGVHWSYLLDSDASVMYGSDWSPAGGGQYLAQRVFDGYSSLDLYLMGLLEPQRVDAFTLLRNPALDPAGLPNEGDRIQAVPETVTLAQVVAAMGPRAPDHLSSPKEFRLGFVFLTAPGVEPSAEDLAAVDRVREAFAGHFFALTRGVAVADTSLAEAPSPPPAPGPDLDRALAWLLAQQAPDGRWEDAPRTAVRDTAAALEALRTTGAAAAPSQRGRDWIAAAPSPSLDHAARRARALAHGASSPAQKAALASALLAAQSPDGGFAVGAGYQSDAHDTALALRALAALDHPPGDTRIGRALAALDALQHPAGGWPAISGGGVSTVVTAEALAAALDWSDLPQAAPLLARGLPSLLARRNADGGFGESPSTAYTTALAADVLARAAGPASAVQGALAWLQARQLEDGSWGGSRYQTALVLSALKGGAANLVVASDTLTLEPSPANEGQLVHVAAQVRNTGRQAAPPTRARLYDGPPSQGALVGEVGVDALEAGASAAVAFLYPTEDKAGPHTLYVVADAAAEVAEAREDDNAASRPLEVRGELPDLAIGPLDIVVTPDPPEEGEAAQVAVTVHNSGRRTSLPALLLLTRGHPAYGGTAIGQSPLPSIAAGGSVTRTLAWDTTGALGTHQIFAVADADQRNAEPDETNNQASITVSVTASLPPGPDLEVSVVEPTPSRLVTLPQPLVARVRVRNLGRDAAQSTLALRDGPGGPTLGEQPIALPGRSSALVTLPVVLAVGGDHTLVAVADPAGTLPETDETNNQAAASVPDPRDTVDLETAEVVPSSTDLVVGETLTVTARLRNRGTAAVSEVPVILARDTGSGLAELARQTVAVGPGSHADLTLSWTTSFTGDPVPLAVVADPFGLFAELSEQNNRADVPVRIRPSERPNLAVSGADIAFLPDPPQEGGSAAVSVLVRNTGAVPAGPFAVRFFRGDPASGGTLLGEARPPGLAGGESVTAQVTWSPVDARGAQGVFVDADAAGEVDEYDEGDNRAFRPFSVQGWPDLVLSAAEVSLDPGYPRSGEPVTVRARVLNLGGQASGPALLRVHEGEGPAAALVGEAAIPALAPGAAALLALPWTPAWPPGERALVLRADADDLVSEQDEGNNLVRHTVVVQDADLYLTEPYFSPDGDGVKDQTRLAYRSTGAVTVVVSDQRGRSVRTLATDAPASGSVAWDGRDGRGRLMWDGTYTFTVTGAGGRVLGRAQAVLDTNRSPIHEAAGTRLLALRNLTCTLPDLRGPAWMPAEDELLLILPEAQGELAPGLLRLGLDGTLGRVGPPDAWYAEADFVSASAVSPDGTAVLVRLGPAGGGGEVYVVDLSTGDRRPLASTTLAEWSPDGRFVLADGKVLERNGSTHAELPGWMTAWSPDGAWLAHANTVVRRDGTGLRELPLPGDITVRGASQTTWREDGLLFTRVTDEQGARPGRGPGRRQNPGGDSFYHFLLDPHGSAPAVELAWLDQVAFWNNPIFWTPDGSKALFRAPDGTVGVANEDGVELRLLAPGADPLGLHASPRGTALAYWGDPVPPGSACHGSGWRDLMVATNLQNLAAEMRAERLPGNNGIQVVGTAADRNLQRIQLDYALASTPATWHPIGAAFELPVLDDLLGAWVPPAPGTYLLRLSVQDRAGNERTRVQTVSWDRMPAIANLTQTEPIISPTGDGVKDAVRFDYLVQEPTRMEVRVVGPVHPGAPPPPTVRRFSFDHPTLGPAHFEWDGRDESGQVVRDGRYTALLNDVPMRVQVDATPPDIGFAYSHLRPGKEARLCGLPGEEQPRDMGFLAVDRAWHVVDDHLKKHTLGDHQVYEPERDAEGNVIYDDGVPRVLRRDGRAVDVVESSFQQTSDRLPPADSPMARFEAEDHAGNRSAVPVAPVAERLALLEIQRDRDECSTRKDLPPFPPSRLSLLPETRPAFKLDHTVRDPALPFALRFQHRASAASPWTEAAQDPLGPFRMTECRHGWCYEADLAALGVDNGVHHGRFAAASGGREFHSEEFRFQACEAVVRSASGVRPEHPVVGVEELPGSDLANYTVAILADIPEPLISVTLKVAGGQQLAGFQASRLMTTADGSEYRATVLAPRVACGLPRTLSFAILARGQSGRVYEHAPPCRWMHQTLPECGCALQLAPEQLACAEASADAIHLKATGYTRTPGTRLRLERGGEPWIVVDEIDVPVSSPASPFERALTIDVTGLPEGQLPVRGLLFKPGAPPEECARAAASPFIDRTAPGVDVRQPTEGGTLCVSPDPASGREVARLLLDLHDAAPRLEIVSLEYRHEAGPWQPLSRMCRDPQCQGDPTHLVTGLGVPLDVDLTGRPAGQSTIRITLCDRAGHQRTVERRFFLTREPPRLTLLRVERPHFSPNGDGLADDTAVVVRTHQALRLTVEVRTASNGLVRRLVEDQTLPANDHAFTWDGRGATGDVVAEGRYRLVVSALDGCGRSGQVLGEATLDLTRPVSLVSQPGPGETVPVSVDVLGVAWDHHLAGFTLSAGAGVEPGTWTTVSSGANRVGAPGQPGWLGRWDPPALEGPYTLRLVTTDRALNSSEARVTVTVGPRLFLDHLAVTPALFSPNGDGRRETATIEYELILAGRVTLQVRDLAGAAVRTLESGLQRPPGVFALLWDGSTDASGPAADGEYRAWIRVEPPEGGGTPQEHSVAVMLDRAAPELGLLQPTSGAHLSAQQWVRGTARDPRLLEWAVEATPAGGAAVELMRGTHDVVQGDLAPLAVLGDGPHALSLRAEDQAENRASLTLAFTVDSMAPTVDLLAPAPGAVLSRTGGPHAVTGTVLDANLQEWVLGFGAGPNPAYFAEVSRGTGGGIAMPLGAWAVSMLADGAYTLRLLGRDRADNGAEARATVTLDGTPPQAVIAQPAADAFLAAEADVTGTAADANLQAWTLELAPGPPATAFQWTELAAGSAGVSNGTLGRLSPLPPDGPHTLRLTVKDAAGHASAAIRGLTVDTAPPPAPAGLEAEVRPAGSTADVKLTWNGVADAGLLGYLVSRDGEPLFATPVAAPTYTDAGRPDGQYQYAVVAVDRAGNRSTPAAVATRVDLTPPFVHIASPADGTAVSGAVVVRGTAFAADDFKEYRLLVGAGASPSTWTLLRRSTLPVSAGTLGTWTATSSGPHVLALEAEDVSGNQARATAAVVVDTQPPTAPVLASVAAGGAPDTLVATWQPSPEPDVEGYLVYRNGRIANAPGIVLGDLRQYLVPPPSYADPELPDGNQCYRVRAMDQAGNLSAPSNELCQPLDNRRPHALILEPAAGTRFEFPLRVIAHTPDTDVLDVRFEYRPAGGGAWLPIGAPDPQPVYEATFDPQGLARGAYELRAVARDAGGEDPSPAVVGVVYGDTTPPAVPGGLTARADGDGVSLQWSAVPAPDLEGYHVYRGEERLSAAPLPQPAHEDAGRTPAAYLYRVSAVDQDGNESARSEPAEAVVYTLALESPFPVTAAAQHDLSGTGARASTTVRILRGEEAVAQAGVAAPGPFTVPAVPLQPGPNLLRARGEDALGNRSIASEEALIVSNGPPPAVAGLNASVDGHSVDLAWPAVADPELFGYLVRRGESLLTGEEPQSEASAIEASSTLEPHLPELAFDGDPSTLWQPHPEEDPRPTWTVTFPGPVLVRSVRLAFRHPWGASQATDYDVLVRWQGRFVPVVRARGNTAEDVEHVLPTSFATDAVRVVLLAGMRLGLGEVAVSRLAAVPAGTTAFRDEAVPDGVHTYRVTAVDVYGAEGPAGQTQVPVGDVTAPGAPTGLVATVTGSDVSLTWSPNGEADLAFYRVLRDALPIATVAAPAYGDAGRPNGTYAYRVVAVDQVGNESAPSAPATAVVAVAPPAPPVLAASPTAAGAVALSWSHAGADSYAVHRATTDGGPYAPLARVGQSRAHLDGRAAPGVAHHYVVYALDAYGNPSAASNQATATPQRAVPPAAPTIFLPTDAEHPVTLESPITDVAGRAEAEALVQVMVGGVLAGVTEAGPAFAPADGPVVPAEAAAWALSPSGRHLAYSLPEDGGAIRLVDTATHLHSLLAGGGWARARAFSPDGQWLAYGVAPCAAEGCSHDLLAVHLEAGTLVSLEAGAADAREAAWSPDGTHVAYAADGAGACEVRIRRSDGTDAPRLLASEPQCSSLRFAPDGARLAFVAGPTGPGRRELKLVPLSGGPAFTVDAAAWEHTVPAWTHDGSAVAYTWAGGPRMRVRRFMVAAGTHEDLTDPTVSSFDPRFDPTGGWMSYATHAGETAKLTARSLDRGFERVVASLPGAAPGSLALHEWDRTPRLVAALPHGAGAWRVVPLPAEGRFDLAGVHLRPGGNLLTANATDAVEGLTGPDSAPVQVTVPAALFADLSLSPGETTAYPEVPLVGQATQLRTRVRNLGAAAADGVVVRFSVRDAAGATVLQQDLALSTLAPGASAVLSTSWTPALAGTFAFAVEADPLDALPEAREDNNGAQVGLWVVAQGAVVVEVKADREAYPAETPARVDVKLLNGGPASAGTLRTTVATPDGAEVALLDSRPVDLGYGGQLAFSVFWNTGRTYAGDYVFKARLEASSPAQGLRPFRIVPHAGAAARIVPARTSVVAGTTATFAARVENRSLNAPLQGAVARLAIVPAAGGTAVFTEDRPLPILLPGAAWEATLAWPAAGPAGAYRAELHVLSGAQTLAVSQVAFTVTAAAGLRGSLALQPAHVLHNGVLQALATVTNLGNEALVDAPFAVEVTSGASAEPILRETFSLTLAPGATGSTTLPLQASVPAGTYPAFLRALQPLRTLARTTLHVHGPITAPSIDSPPEGSRVGSSHPLLAVNNAVGAPGAPLVYDFQLFRDPGLAQPLPGAAGLPETPLRTTWRVAINLGEDQTYYWRARARDGFSSSPWTAVASFTVDARNDPPAAPVPDRPRPGERVPTREPALAVRNALDPENAALSYEFRLATDPAMASIVASASGVPEGADFTAWTVPVSLTENATYHWSARASDGSGLSPWSPPVSFTVDSVDEAPSAPLPLEPAEGAEVATLQPPLVAENALDPEGLPLTYRFEVDESPAFGSPALQAVTGVPEGTGATSWTAPLPLRDNTMHYWRVSAHDGHGASPWAPSHFFVNTANDPPGAPLPLEPAAGVIVPTATPTLRVRNAEDPDRDELTYDFRVADEAGATVAEAVGVAQGAFETTWTVPAPLAEDTRFYWSARASDGEAVSPWSAAQDFRVNAQPDPPTAPTLVAPAEGSVVAVARPALVVANATSPEGLPLTYTFELYRVAADGSLALIERAEGQAPGAGQTSWTPSQDLVDGAYSWRSRAVDAHQPGSWMASAHFTVALDAPPAPPAGLSATPGNQLVRLAWTASPEGDVTGYRVYRATSAGGPYTLAGSPASPAHDDTGLTNGTTYYYVVTALDATSESAHSAEVAATPLGVTPAEVRFSPETIDGECVIRAGGSCPSWLYATVELPAGHDPASIQTPTVRLAGSVPPDPAHGRILDGDGDGIPERELRFELARLRPLLSIGPHTLSVSGQAAAGAFHGQRVLTVRPLAVGLFVTPRTLNRASQGSEVHARLTLLAPARASDVSTASLRLNETLSIKRVVSSQGQHLTVAFLRAAVASILPLGDQVQVRVSGTARGLPLLAVDHIRVIDCDEDDDAREDGDEECEEEDDSPLAAGGREPGAREGGTR